MARRAPHCRGFTLLEVLASVAVFGIVYTVLAQTAMQGLAAEGDASRRLHASLLADTTLGELEAQLASGSAPAQGLTEHESEEYRITVEVLPLDLAALLPSELPDFLAELAGPVGRPLELLRAPPRGAAPLLEIRIAVLWQEGAFEQSVTRTTFATDPAVLAPLLETLQAGDEDDSEDGDPDDEDEDAEDTSDQEASR